MTKAYCAQNVVWTPSKMIARLGKEIDNRDSVYYWCYKVHLFFHIGHHSYLNSS